MKKQKTLKTLALTVAMARSKRQNRKGVTMLIACALLLTLTQCRKNVETITPINQGGVNITVNVTNGSKHSVITTEGVEQGKVYFNVGDELYVGNGGQFVGTLYFDGENFTGQIGIDDEPPYHPLPLTYGEKLHFYYTGGYTEFDYANEENGDIYLYFNMSDQSGNLPVFSYGCTSNNLEENVNSYSCTLLNKCALVKFDITENTSDDVVVLGMCSEVKFTFGNLDADVFVPSGKRDPITLNSRGDNNNEKWAILLPQEEVENATVVIGSTLYADAVDVPAIHNNDLLKLTIDTSSPSAYEPVFSTGNGKTVRFAPGNLQYQASTNTWRFAERQYHYVGGRGKNNIHYGNVEGSTNDNPSSTYSGWIDLFMWGTSNWDNTATDPLSIYYHPWDERGNGTGNENNPWGIGPSYNNPVSRDIDGTNYDWGVYNDIYNPSTESVDQAGTWRTPTAEEMEYLLESRPNAASLKGMGIVEDVWGLILLPDIWLKPQGVSFSSTGGNSYTEAQWLQMEAKGALFFPCGGSYREIGDVFAGDEDGVYWLATHYEESKYTKDSFGPADKAYALGFFFFEEDGDLFQEVFTEDEYRYYHNAVRLIQDID